MPTMAFLEFRLSGLKSASKPRAPESPAFCSRVGPPNSLGLLGPIYAHRYSWVPSARSGSHGSRMVAGGRGLCGTKPYEALRPARKERESY
jgi:hypothetical protein